jgi:hypothetical protein
MRMIAVNAATWLSWAALGGAAMNAGALAFSRWAINAEGIGARDPRQALFFSFVHATAIFICIYSAPILAAFAAASSWLDRGSSWRFLWAALVSGLALLAVYLVG